MSEDSFSDEEQIPEIGEDIAPTIEVPYPLNEETEVPQTKGQLFKTVLREGSGPKPPKGAKVSVHYVGTLASDGSQFDSSRDRGELFEFTLGQGQVIKGWDQGVATMRKGEKCNLKCLPEYAYGARGSPPKIPADATLNFEVELFDWTKSEDISEHKDKSILKKTLVEGKDWDRPEYESACVLSVTHYATEADDQSTVESLGVKEDWKVTIGETELPAGIEAAIKSMKKGEVSDIVLKSLDRPCAELPSLETFVGKKTVVRIELKEFTSIKTWSFKGSQKLEEGKKRKDQGNAYFKEKSYQKAIEKYKRGLEFVEHEYGLEESDKAEAKALKVSMWSNTAQCYLNLGKHVDCVSFCNKVLEAEPGNAKALFRRGKAEGARQNWDEGIKDMKKLLEMDPSNADAARELGVIQEALRQHNAKQKARYGNMFAKLSAMEEKEKHTTQPQPASNKEEPVPSAE